MFKIGIGYDIHKKLSTRPLYLGGILISKKNGLLGHSDADILIHTICDSILGALAEGDIGDHFSDSDPKNKNKRSTYFLKKILKIMQKRSYKIVNIDSTIICEKPKLSRFKNKMRMNISRIINLPIDKISVKATTSEGLGIIGKDMAMACKTIVLLKKNESV